MISDPKYEYDYSEFYQRYSAISNLNRLICPLFKDPLVNNEKEEPRGRRIVKSLKSHCVNKITSYNQVWLGSSHTNIIIFVIFSVDKASERDCPPRDPQ